MSDFESRKKTWKANNDLIWNLNKESKDSGNPDAPRYSHNHLSDRTPEELERMRGLVEDVTMDGDPDEAEFVDKEGRRLTANRKEFRPSGRELAAVTLNGADVDWSS